MTLSYTHINYNFFYSFNLNTTLLVLCQAWKPIDSVIFEAAGTFRCGFNSIFFATDKESRIWDQPLLKWQFAYIRVSFDHFYMEYLLCQSVKLSNSKFCLKLKRNAKLVQISYTICRVDVEHQMYHNVSPPGLKNGSGNWRESFSAIFRILHWRNPIFRFFVATFRREVLCRRRRILSYSDQQWPQFFRSH